MARGGDGAQPQATRDERLPVVHAYVDVRRDACPVHDPGDAEPSRELARRREVIRVRVRVDYVVKADTGLADEGERAIDLRELGIDHQPGAGLAARDHVRAAAAGADLSKIMRAAITGPRQRHQWPATPLRSEQVLDMERDDFAKEESHDDHHHYRL